MHWNRLIFTSWWRHQMETFSALLVLCAGNSPVAGEFPPRRPMTRSFDVFFGLRLNKRLCKQSRRRWFETPSHSLWRHNNVHIKTRYKCGYKWSWISFALISIYKYRKTSSISRTKSRNSNVSCILLRLSSLNPLKPGVKLRMKM